MMVSLDDQVKAYVKKIMSQLNKWIQKSKISKLVIVVTSKETGEHLERWQFDVSTSKLCRKCTTTDIFRSTSSTTKASQSARHPHKIKRTPHRKRAPTLQHPLPRSRSPKSSKKSSRSSAKSQHPSRSCQCWTATAHSTSWCTPMPTVTCLSNGVTATQRRSRTPRRSN